MVATVKPVHALVAAIMQDVGTPELIVDGAASPHTYSFKPSNATALSRADLVFRIGPGFETFLEKPLESLSGKALIVTLADAPGVTTLPLREGGLFEPHEDGDDQAEKDSHGHDHAGPHGEIDMHLWLDPANAKAMANEIARRLATADPDHAQLFERNRAELARQIDEMDARMKEKLAPFRHKPFIVFHDAYQYLERAYGLTVAGSITVSPEAMPGARRIQEIHAKILSAGAVCVFAEPQFEPRLVETVLEGTPAHAGTLDPEGGSLKPGAGLYLTLMDNLATSLVDCLSKAS